MSGSTLDFELGATRDHIVLTSNGNLELSALLNLSLLSGSTLAIGQTFLLFEGAIGGIAGTFSAVNAPIIDGHTRRVVYGTNQVMLQVVQAGDYNGNGVGDGADYVIWRKGLDTSFSQYNFHTWRSNFGQAAGNGADVKCKSCSS